VTVQEVRQDVDGSQPADSYIFFCGIINANHYVETGFVIHQGIRSTVGCWCVNDVMQTEMHTTEPLVP
jgi:hypothetical protein